MEWRRKSVNSLPIRAFPFKLRQTDERTYLERQKLHRPGDLFRFEK